MGAFAHPAYYFQITNMFSCPKMFLFFGNYFKIRPMKNKIGKLIINSTKCETILNCKERKQPKSTNEHKIVYMCLIISNNTRKVKKSHAIKCIYQ